LTALSLLAAFEDKAQVDSVDISDPVVLSGMLIGSMLPYLFSALTMLSVQKVRQNQFTTPNTLFVSNLTKSTSSAFA
jgi:Na+/H+-translocating membrane pyrophosphatase